MSCCGNWHRSKREIECVCACDGAGAPAPATSTNIVVHKCTRAAREMWILRVAESALSEQKNEKWISYFSWSTGDEYKFMKFSWANARHRRKLKLIRREHTKRVKIACFILCTILSDRMISERTMHGTIARLQAVATWSTGTKTRHGHLRIEMTILHLSHRCVHSCMCYMLNNLR